jgi:hypothetical protein
MPDDGLSDGGADFGGLMSEVSDNFVGTFAIAASLNLNVVSKNKVVFITMGTSWWGWG